MKCMTCGMEIDAPHNCTPTSSKCCVCHGLSLYHKLCPNCRETPQVNPLTQALLSQLGPTFIRRPAPAWHVDDDDDEIRCGNCVCDPEDCEQNQDDVCPLGDPCDDCHNYSNFRRACPI